MDRLTQKRGRKVRDLMHKASRKIIDLAVQEDVGTIVIGRNAGWKQRSSMGKRKNQNFVSIPYHILIEMIQYKAALAGITVKLTVESYTSGTSYLDGEYPDRGHYKKSRRKTGTVQEQCRDLYQCRCERGISDHESRRGQGHSRQGRGTGPQDQCSLNYIR